MGKRRRERDKPKAAPDAAYNPNKRVLLSYASDDENEAAIEQAAGIGHLGAVNTATASYEIPPYPETDGDEDGLPEGGAFAPDPVDALEESDAEGKEDEEQNQPALFSRASKKNVATGQWPALGSMSYQWDDEGEEPEDYDSAEEEAMAYLRAVRTERQAMPTVFRAPCTDETEELYDSGVGDGRGYVEEGTSVGRPRIGPNMPESAKASIEPQEAYTRVLKQRFLDQRKQMHVMPGNAALATLTDKHPTIFAGNDNKSYANWQRLLKTTVPLSAHVRSLSVDSVTRLLGLISKMHLVRGHYLSEKTSVWIWSLLTRLDDVGTMNNEEVFAIREFGKKAVLVQLSFHDPAAAAQLEQMSADVQPELVSTTGAGKEDGNHDENTHGSNGHLPQTPEADSPARQTTFATLDMIIIIVGEIFGQRDLLEFRRQWEMDEEKADTAAG